MRATPPPSASCFHGLLDSRSTLLEVQICSCPRRNVHATWTSGLANFHLFPDVHSPHLWHGLTSQGFGVYFLAAWSRRDRHSRRAICSRPIPLHQSRGQRHQSKHRRCRRKRLLAIGFFCTDPAHMSLHWHPPHLLSERRCGPRISLPNLSSHGLFPSSLGQNQFTVATACCASQTKTLWSSGMSLPSLASAASLTVRIFAFGSLKAPSAGPFPGLGPGLACSWTTSNGTSTADVTAQTANQS